MITQENVGHNNRQRVLSRPTSRPGMSRDFIIIYIPEDMELEVIQS